MGRSDLGLAAADPEDWSPEAAAVSATGFRVERELGDERPQARGGGVSGLDGLPRARSGSWRVRAAGSG